MSTVTAKQLHQETKSILDQLERGEPVLITRNGRPIGRLEPIRPEQPLDWGDVMKPVWEAQERVRPLEVQPNPVLEERRRRRR